MFQFDTAISTGNLVLLAVCLLVAFAFEFANGFHDTANAVATVIYTNSMQPTRAVVLSAALNFAGVFLGGISVAMKIIKLLPVELLVSSGASSGLAMVLALLLAAVIWNVGTWYFGLPASSSHTLIGAILGVGLINALVTGKGIAAGINWHAASHVGLALLCSPLFGFTLGMVLLWASKRALSDRRLHEPVMQAPPTWVRGVLIGTCAGVSFAHGSNDGQKGVGLVMLILIGLLPADYAVNRDLTGRGLENVRAAVRSIDRTLQQGNPEALAHKDVSGKTLRAELAALRSELHRIKSVGELAKAQRWEVRKQVLLVSSMLNQASKKLSSQEAASIHEARKQMREITDYAPSWVIIMIALALGVGTMVGWKRIVVTVGEKIGKTGLTYAQGASAQIVAMSTIGASSFLGLPVSTTHVLSSAIAGTMVAHKAGLQKKTVASIGLAWVLTLPAAMLLSALLFLLLRTIFG
ncbi:MAG: inorganic phosphate transporter [Myxococcales bacterium]|nr:inorganic phosphate transporter [Myxococcales bacterium]